MGKVRSWKIQVEVWFQDENVQEQYDYYLNTNRHISVDKDWLGSGFDLFEFETKAERTKILRDLKKIGVPENLIVLTKEIGG